MILDISAIKFRPIRCLKTSGTNYPVMRRKISAEWARQIVSCFLSCLFVAGCSCPESRNLCLFHCFPDT